MERIGRNVVVCEQPKKGNKAVKHLVNAGFIGGGIAAIGISSRNAMNKFDWANAAKYGASNQRYEDSFKKLHKFVTKYSDKLFPKNGKIAKAIERYSGMGFMTGGRARGINLYKGKLAIASAAVTAALALAGIGLYQAGKINGK